MGGGGGEVKKALHQNRERLNFISSESHYNSYNMQEDTSYL